MNHHDDDHDAPILCLHHVDVFLSSQHVLHGISLTMNEGDAIAIRGHNGSGKTTLIRTILGLIPIASGSIQWFGKPLHIAKNHRDYAESHAIGYVPQFASPGLNGATVQEVMEFGIQRSWQIFNRATAAQTLAIASALEVCGMQDLASRRFEQLSGGQQKRVLIARAIAQNPKVLILDEPLAGVDRANQEVIVSIVNDLIDKNVTVAAVIHDTGALMDTMTRAVELQDGRIIHDGVNRA